MPGNSGDIKYRYAIFSGGKFVSWERDENGEEFMRDLVFDTTTESIVKATNDEFGAKLGSTKAPKSPSSRTRAGILTKSELRNFRTRQVMEWNRKAKVDNSISSQDGVVVVSYFLPVLVKKSDAGIWSACWDEENILSLRTNHRVTWVGTVRYPGGVPTDEEDQVAQILMKMNCYPVFVKSDMKIKFYDNYCKRTLWPILHQIADVYSTTNSDRDRKEENDCWFAFTTVTRLFRDRVVEVYQNGDLVWIHGFHLMLLPSFLRRLIPLAKIGIFFHTPFPSSEIWRTMNRREDLLRGLLGADHIGFHLYEYARHLLSTCRRLLGHSYEMNASGTLSINVDGRDIALTCMHVGIDQPSLLRALATSAFETQAMQWKKRWPGKVIFAALDRLERLKGIPLKLMGIERFLEANPQWEGKLAFPIIGISAKERQDDYLQTLYDTRLLVDRINKRHGTPNDPVVYFEERADGSMSVIERLSFFASADVLIIASPRDGLNRTPMEFTIARKAWGEYVEKQGLTELAQVPGAGLPSQGLLIISEFVSSARVMRGGLMINPWGQNDLVNALRRCLEMNPTERADRMRRNVEFSTRLTTANWATHVLHDLKIVEKSEDHTEYSALGLGMGFRVMGVKSGFKSADTKNITKAYRTARKRLILLDWGGTLVAESEKVDRLQAYAVAQGHVSRSGPGTELLDILAGLSKDPKNCVFVVTGKDVLAVSEFFGEIVGLGLGAEHGFYYRWPSKENSVSSSTGNNPRGTWQTMLSNTQNQNWKEPAQMVMNIFVNRTHGSYIEQKGNALIWQFSDTDPEFGYLQSKEIEEHLNAVLAEYPVEVIRGGGVNDGYIEVRPSGVSKGLFLAHVLASLRALENSSSKVDFVLAIGDDASDEPMFEELNRINQESELQMKAFGITVGKKPTQAEAYLDDVPAVLELLKNLTKSSDRDKRFFSTLDLTQKSLALGGNDVKNGGNGNSSSNGGLNSGSLTRALSDGNISGTQLDESLMSSLVGNKPISKVPSRVDISMSQYLEGIEEEDDAGGIFF